MTWLGCTCRVPAIRLWTAIVFLFLTEVLCVLRCIMRGRRVNPSLVELLTAMTCLLAETLYDNVPSRAAPLDFAFFVIVRLRCSDIVYDSSRVH